MSEETAIIGEIQDASEWTAPTGGPRTGMTAAVRILAVNEGFHFNTTDRNGPASIASREGRRSGKTFHTSKVSEGKYRVWRSA